MFLLPEKTQKVYLTSLWEFVANLLLYFQLKLVVSDYFLFFPGVTRQHLQSGIVRDPSVLQRGWKWLAIESTFQRENYNAIKK